MAFSGVRVLVVEDDRSMREAIERLLGAAGFEPAAYASGESLLDDATAPEPACVVCDLKLPGISGFDVLAALRDRDAHTPVIVITAFDTPGLREEAMQRGAAAYLVKPFLGTTLIEAIRSVIACETSA